MCATGNPNARWLTADCKDHPGASVTTSTDAARMNNLLANVREVGCRQGLLVPFSLLRMYRVLSELVIRKLKSETEHH